MDFYKIMNIFSLWVPCGEQQLSLPSPSKNPNTGSPTTECHFLNKKSIHQCRNETWLGSSQVLQRHFRLKDWTQQYQNSVAVQCNNPKCFCTAYLTTGCNTILHSLIRCLKTNMIFKVYKQYNSTESHHHLYATIENYYNTGTFRCIQLTLVRSGQYFLVHLFTLLFQSHLQQNILISNYVNVNPLLIGCLLYLKYYQLSHFLVHINKVCVFRL